MATLILIAYLVGFALTWIIGYGMMYRDDGNHFGGPIETILTLGFFSLCIAAFWPIVILVFFVHRIATYVPNSQREEQK